MSELATMIYIHDLDISDKSKNFLIRAGIIRLSELLSFDTDKLSDMRGIGEGTLCELLDVIAHSDEVIMHHEKRKQRIEEILPEVQNVPIEKVGLGTRSINALRRAGIRTVGALVQMSQKDIFELRNVGVLSREEIVAAIDAILNEGADYFDKVISGIAKTEDSSSAPRMMKGFDFAVIDVLIETFGFKPARMAEWFGLSRQGIYNALETRSPLRMSVWTGKALSETEAAVLTSLIDNTAFEYQDDNVTCCLCLSKGKCSKRARKRRAEAAPEIDMDNVGWMTVEADGAGMHTFWCS